MLIVIVASGTTVRLTGSGLGCRHWPGCTAGDPFPQTGYHSFIEFSNRIVASFTIVATLARLRRDAPDADRAPLGALGRGPRLRRDARAGSARRDHGPLPAEPLARAARHFLLSIVVLALGVIVALEAWGVRGEPVPLARPPARAARRGRAARC